MNSIKAREIIDRYFEMPVGPATLAVSGLVALDVVINDADPAHPLLQTGGSCGNLSCILASWGWQVYPFSRMNQERPSQHVMEDFRHWGVRTDFCCLEPQVDIPLVVHAISHNAAGDSFHRFSWNCPSCGGWLPTYQPLTLVAAHSILGKVPVPSVFYMDRVSPANLQLAREFRSQGTLIVFEPTGVGDARLFLETLELTNVLKYSHERMRKIREIHEVSTPLLEIETLGKEGLRYRSRLIQFPDRSWHRLESFPVARLEDAAGAGDWCTAALLHGIGSRAVVGLSELTEEEWRELLCYAQALSAWNCGFKGARGGMYLQTPAQIKQQLFEILSGAVPRLEKLIEPGLEVHKLFQELCPQCKSSKRK
jgi:sugar/nucleoside kinase (ribokinase family)